MCRSSREYIHLRNTQKVSLNFRLERCRVRSNCYNNQLQFASILWVSHKLYCLYACTSPHLNLYHRFATEKKSFKTFVCLLVKVKLKERLEHEAEKMTGRMVKGYLPAIQIELRYEQPETWKQSGIQKRK